MFSIMNFLRMLSTLQPNLAFIFQALSTTGGSQIGGKQGTKFVVYAKTLLSGKENVSKRVTLMTCKGKN